MKKIIITIVIILLVFGLGLVVIILLKIKPMPSIAIPTGEIGKATSIVPEVKTVIPTPIELPIVSEALITNEITRQNVVALINQSRRDNHLPTLIVNKDLEVAAQEKADDMVTRQYFGHQNPESQSVWNLMFKHGYSFIYAGENLAVQFKDVKTQHQAWLDSEFHRKNILSDKFNNIGVGIATGIFKDIAEAIYVVVLFGSR